MTSRENEMAAINDIVTRAIQCETIEVMRAILRDVLVITAKKITIYGKEVDEIYKAYPRHIAVGAAKKSIINAIKRGVTAEFLLERVKVYAKAKEGCDPQYIPHPSTWFNQERYNDDESEWTINGDKYAKGTRGSGKTHGNVAPTTEDLWGGRKGEDVDELSF